MSTEVFPTVALHAAEVIDRPLPGYQWLDPPGERDRRVCRSLRYPAIGTVAVYIGNGPFHFARGYRDDAVWFEVFGLGGPRGYSGPFFAPLAALFGCEFVTELGQRLTPDAGIDSDDWDPEWTTRALAAMQQSPGSTGGANLYEHPYPPRPHRQAQNPKE